jgi:3-dehydroquinate synthase
MSPYLRVCDRLPLPDAGSLPIVVSATRQDEYRVYVSGIDDVALAHLVTEIGGRRVALITDQTVATLHARRLAGQLAEHGLDVVMTAFQPGEASKSIPTAFGLLNWLADSSLARRDIVLAVGGGVVIDTVGWVASAYMRGVPYMNVPTTLLAQVDAALGGKVAVDHGSAKNLIGAFYQPKAVVSNISYLCTLDRRQLRAGLAEAIKKGVIASPGLFALIENQVGELISGDPLAREALVRGASAIKCALVARDPYEDDLRRPLNFGHTIGHAVETITGYGPVLHGEAVAFGMAVSAKIAEQRRVIGPGLRERIVRLLDRVGLPTALDDLPVTVASDDVVAALGHIRRIRDNQIRFVLPVDIGETLIVDDVSDGEIRAALLSTVREKAHAR